MRKCCGGVGNMRSSFHFRQGLSRRGYGGVACNSRQKWAEPQKRKYEELPVFWDCRNEIIEDELAHQIAELKHKERKERNKK